MKFTTAWEFIEALVQNNGVLWALDGRMARVDKEGQSFTVLKAILEEEIFKLEWFTTEPLKDKAFMEMWDNCDTHVREYGFWDAVYNCAFTYNGKRDGCTFNNYRKITPLPDWAIEAQKTLED